MLPIGKLDSDLLKDSVFKYLTFRHPQVLVRPSLGEDCAILDAGTTLCVLTTDPITGSDGALGRLAVHVNCNDVATQGIRPVGLMLTLLAPEGTTIEVIESVMAQAAAEAERIGVEIIGGHTEITTAVNRLVISGVAVGLKPVSMQPCRKPAPGDLLVMTKTAGLEGTGIIAEDCAKQLAEILTAEELDQGRELLNQVSVVEDGILGAQWGALKMHDITEGGVFGAAWELSEIAGVGCFVECDTISVHSVTRKICSHFEIDPYRLISSGSMMMIFPPDLKEVEGFLKAAEAAGIPASIVGRLTESGRTVRMSDREIPLEAPKSDELYKVIR